MDDTLSFVAGFVYRRDTFYIRAIIPSIEERDIPHAAMLRWQGGEWGRWMIKQRIIGHAVLDLPAGRTSIAVGNDGAVQIGDPGGFHWEHMDQSREAPNKLRGLRAFRPIEDHLYAVGMSRMIYRRPMAGGDWKRFDKDVRVPRSSKEISAFHAIGGTGSQELYAAGLTGQLWRFDGEFWRKTESGTNLGLLAIETVNPEQTYICGNSGTVIRGHGDEWRFVENEATEEDFWSMANLDGTIYLATNEGNLYKIESDEVVPVEHGLKREITTYSLHVADGVLLSVGSNDILVFDGETWTEVEHPPSQANR